MLCIQSLNGDTVPLGITLKNRALCESFLREKRLVGKLILFFKKAEDHVVLNNQK